MYKILFLLPLILFCTVCTAQTPFNKAEIDSLFDILDAADKLYGSVAIAKNGNIIYERVLGINSADKTGNYPMRVDHPRSRIGSITKSVTAVLIMQLIDENKLSLNATLSTWFPGIAKADSITIEHMLTHRSGIHSFDNDINENDFDDWSYKPQTKEYLLQKLAGYPSDFSPGTKEMYSNAAYLLLGYIIEAVSNKSYADVLEERITIPLQLSHMHYSEMTDTSTNEVFSYIKDKGWEKWPSAHLSLAGGAGSIVSTAADVCKFYNAIFNGNLISKESLDFLKRTGTGLNKQDDFGGFYGTTGKIDKYFANVAYMPKDSVTMSVSINGFNYPFGQIFFKMASIYYNDPVEMPDFSGSPLAKDSLAFYCGSYQMRSGMVIKIEEKQKQLFFVLKADGYGTLPLTALKNGWLVNDEQGIILAFGRNEKGVITRFTMYQANQVIRAEKIK